MNSYTAHKSERVNDFVQNHLDHITQEIRSLMNNDVEAIILAGGFGRGEGSVIEDNGKLHIVNDYDIDIIYNNRINPFLTKIYIHLKYRKKINQIALRLAEKFDIKQIDLNFKSSDDLSKTSYKLAEYDLANGHVVLYTRNLDGSLIPDFPSDKIPAFEGTWLLKNRAIGLLLASYYIDKDKLDTNKEEYFYIEINKAILAMGDALFILKKSYVCSYQKRQQAFDELCSDDIPAHKELRKLYNNAASYKLLPQQNMHPEYSSLELYHRVCNIYCDFFLYYESSRLDKSINDIQSYTNHVSENRIHNLTKYRLRQLFEKISGNKLPQPKDFIILKLDKNRSVAASLCLLFNYSKRCDETTCQKCLQTLLGNQTIGRYTTQEITRLFLLLIHPKGELGKVLG